MTDDGPREEVRNVVPVYTIGLIETLIKQHADRAVTQAILNFHAQYKTERTAHTLGTPVSEWKRELEHLDEFVAKYLNQLQESE